jgi:hypothetical protein
MSADYVERLVTVTIDGDECDVRVRSYVEVAPWLGVGGSWGARLDGDPDVMVEGEWCPLDSVNVGPRDRDRIEEALCDRALEDA